MTLVTKTCVAQEQFFIMLQQGKQSMKLKESNSIFEFVYVAYREFINCLC
jgi:hypothetical protein